MVFACGIYAVWLDKKLGVRVEDTLVYDELKRLAEHYLRDERRDHTLQPTARS